MTGENVVVLRFFHALRRSVLELIAKRSHTEASVLYKVRVTVTTIF
jgi:hypothetical protein